MGFEFFIAKRYLRSPRNDQSISVITKIAVIGVAIGVMVLITALSMMNGMEKELRSALKGANSDLTVYSYSSDGFEWKKESTIVQRIKQLIDVKSYAPFTQHQAIIMGPHKSLVTILKGIDIINEPKVSPLHFLVRTESFVVKRDNTHSNQLLSATELKKAQAILEDLKPHFEIVKNEKGVNVKQRVTGIIIGSQLARNLKVGINDKVTIMSFETRMTPMGEVPRVKRFKIIGFYESGLMGYDEVFSLVDMGVAQKVFRMKDKISGLTIALNDELKAELYRVELEDKIGYPYDFTTWMQQNKNMFATFQLEKMALSIILTLIILISSFLIVSSLIMLVIEKTKDIAILKAMGAKDSSIRKIFILQGSMIGLTGTIIGEILGLLICWTISRFDIIDIPAGVYVGNRIPMLVETWQIILIAVVSFVICFFVTIIPSQKAAKLDPVEGMRNE